MTYIINTKELLYQHLQGYKLKYSVLHMSYINLK